MWPWQVSEMLSRLIPVLQVAAFFLGMAVLMLIIEWMVGTEFSVGLYFVLLATFGLGYFLGSRNAWQSAERHFKSEAERVEKQRGIST